MSWGRWMVGRKDGTKEPVDGNIGPSMRQRAMDNDVVSWEKCE
jgi:hypothetical protein